MEIDYKFIQEVVKELGFYQSQLSRYDDEAGGQLSTYSKWAEVAHCKFKCTVLCSLIAHSRKVSHLAGYNLERQQKFLEDNKKEWYYLKFRVKNKPVIVPVKEIEKAQEAKKKRTFFDAIRDIL